MRIVAEAVWTLPVLFSVLSSINRSIEKRERERERKKEKRKKKVLDECGWDLGNGIG